MLSRPAPLRSDWLPPTHLLTGVVSEMMLRELFNGALASLVPDPQTNPPVVNCQLDPTGRFGFVELRSEELATSAMSLDKVSSTAGRLPSYLHPSAPCPASSLAVSPYRCDTRTAGVSGGKCSKVSRVTGLSNHSLTIFFPV